MRLPFPHQPSVGSKLSPAAPSGVAGLFSSENEQLCRYIDQRNADQALITRLTRSLDPPELSWAGQLVVSLNPRAFIVGDRTACPWCTMPGGQHDTGCPYASGAKRMGRHISATTLLRARVREETLAKVELRLYNIHRQKRQYGAMGDLIESLLCKWLAEQERSNG